MAKETEKTASSDRGEGSPVSSSSKGRGLEEEIQDFLTKSLMPFHGMLSVKNMDKKIRCMEYDNVITKLAQVNTILTAKTRDTK